MPYGCPYGCLNSSLARLLRYVLEVSTVGTGNLSDHVPFVRLQFTLNISNSSISIIKVFISPLGRHELALRGLRQVDVADEPLEFFAHGREAAALAVELEKVPE